MDFCETLLQNQIEFTQNEPLSEHTTFKIGGPCDYFVSPATQEQLLTVIETAKECGLPYFILGNGSNLLVSDLGIEGAVISLAKYSGITEGDNTLSVLSGTKLSALCSKALELSLGGMQYFWGIPGTVGGAVFMNAGAYGGEIKDVLMAAKALVDGEIKEFSANECELSYRDSIFKHNGGIILSADFSLKPAQPEQIRAEMDTLIARRKEKQPLEFPSAGSTFKRPKDNFAGTLIEECGLKGYSIGGAMVSPKHAGFIINTGGATASDVRRLIEHIKEQVFMQKSINLESEIIFAGR
ncbi:MAG: UDP-N-acetylmuramate dehydrogenase [Oscillospiraceae bacterium]|nr:UDP-N-acetylmuramate dehydrogenase [Candidatus Equicaccousia limihippi]